MLNLSRMEKSTFRDISFYNFDLDGNAEQKWKSIIDAFAEKLEELRGNLRKILSEFGVATTIIKPIYSLTSNNSLKYYDEICYIAKRIEMDPYEILLMQLVYETSSACTSAVIKIGDQELYLRTMDWPMDFLRDITIGLNLVKNGQVVGKVTTWLGYVGFLTATDTINDYTISINYRRTKEISITSLFKNLYRTATMKWPIGYLVRELVTTNTNREHVVSHLTNCQLVSPCYITVYIPGGKTTMITRDCDKAVNVRTNELVQTNCDWDKNEPNILWSVERRNGIKQAQEKFRDCHEISLSYVIQTLLENHVYNDETIYVHYQFGDIYRTMNSARS